MTDTPKPKARRGFGAMSLEKRTAISRLGGAAVPYESRTYVKHRDIAVSAGKKSRKPKKEPTHG